MKTKEEVAAAIELLCNNMPPADEPVAKTVACCLLDCLSWMIEEPEGKTFQELLDILSAPLTKEEALNIQ